MRKFFGWFFFLLILFGGIYIGVKWVGVFFRKNALIEEVKNQTKYWAIGTITQQRARRNLLTFFKENNIGIDTNDLQLTIIEGYDSTFAKISVVYKDSLVLPKKKFYFEDTISDSASIK